MICQHRTEISQFPTNGGLLRTLGRNRLCVSPFRHSDEYKLQMNSTPTVESKTVDDGPIALCPEHFQRMDIVCLSDKVRICTKCALFGAHKQHEFKSVEDVIREVTQKADNIMYVYQKIQTKQQELSDQKCHEQMGEQFRQVLKEAQQAVREKFIEIAQLFKQKEQKLLDQLKSIVHSLEVQNQQKATEIVGQCGSQIELWKITAKDRLLQFSQSTEQGQLPLELMNSDFGCLEKGHKILEDIDRTRETLDQKVQNIKIKKLKVDFKSRDLEKILDGLFTLTLQMNGATTVQRKPLTISNNDSLITTERKDSEVFSSFYQDDPMLLKDMSLADWSEIITEVEVPMDRTVDRTVDRHLEKTIEKPFIAIEKPIFNYPTTSPMNRLQDENKPTHLRMGVSPTPKIMEKKKKVFKINEKFEQIYQAFKNDVLENADFTGADLQDEGMIVLSDLIKHSRKLRTLKVVRNKITDDGVIRLFDGLLQNHHQNFTSVHLQGNLISERSLDYLLQICRAGNEGSLPKNIYLNQNMINSKAKRKIEELKKLGIIVTI